MDSKILWENKFEEMIVFLWIILKCQIILIFDE